MVFFVTGGSRGIGAAIVLQAVREGHDVALTYLRNAAGAEAVTAQARALRQDVRCRAYQLDVGDSAAVDAVVEQALQDFETVDVLVSNAGINVANLAVSMTDEEWEAVLRTNLTGAFYVSRQLLPAFLANRFGRIIFISSLAHAGISGQANYCASKAGLLGLSGALAKEYGRKGITSNVIVPGFIETDMTREGMSDRHQEFWMKYCPQGRMGTADEVAKAVTFLASEAATFINGQAISLTGGLDWTP